MNDLTRLFSAFLMNGRQIVSALCRADTIPMESERWAALIRSLQGVDAASEINMRMLVACLQIRTTQPGNATLPDIDLPKSTTRDTIRKIRRDGWQIALRTPPWWDFNAAPEMFVRGPRLVDL